MSSSLETETMSKSGDFFSSPSFKLILLTGMVLQNSATVLVGRYTRSSVPVDQLYVVNHLIVVTEVGKLLLSCLFEYAGTNGQLLQSIQTNIIDRPYDALKIMIPALLYLVQNSLLYVALSNLTAPVFQVTYQGKLVTTAVVSVLMLNRRYNFQQWVCLVVLSLGVAIVVLGEQGGSSSKTPAGAQNVALGLVAVTIACLSSALAGVYFEKVVKTSSGEKQKPVSVWMRNIQLAGFTIVTALMQGAWSGSNSAQAVAKPYFHGFTAWAWILVGLQAGGGLLVAAVIKYADNVLKGLATGVSVCFATAVSYFLFGTALSSQFSVGAAMILLSVYVFSNPIGKERGVPSSPGASSGKLNGDEEEMKPILPK
jgi:solute carrier family 35 (UDP-sugar transporter), member A1/2/3